MTDASLAPRPQNGVIRAIVVSGVILLLLLTLPPLSATRLETWPWALGRAIWWSAPMATLLARLATGASWFLPSRTLTAGLLLLGAGSLASAFFSPFSEATSTLLGPTLGGIAGFFLLHDWLLQRPTLEADKRIQAAWVISFVGAIVVCVSLGQWLYRSAGQWTIRNEAPFGHSNYTAGMIVMLLPWFVWCLARAHRVKKVLWLLVLLIALISLAATSSRGGIAALGAMIIFAGSIAYPRLPQSPRIKLTVIASVLVFGALAIGSNERLRDLATGHGWNDAARESNRQRAAMWEAGWLLGKAKPVVGWGPGSAPLAFPLVRAQLDHGVENVLQLHSTPAQLWATLGFAGVAAAALISISAGKLIFARSLPAIDLAAASSLVGFALIALTDHQLDLPAISFLALTALALLASGGVTAPWRPQHKISLVIFFALIALLARPASDLGRDLLARRAYDRALTALEQGDADGFLAGLDAATSYASWDVYYLQRQADFFIVARELAKDAAGKATLAARACAILRASLKNPAHQEFAYFNLGWLELELGQPSLAAHDFVAAAKLVPDRGGVYLGLGMALQSLGKNAAAIRAYALEWINNPRSATAPMWAMADFAPLAPQIRSEVTRLYAGPLARVPDAVRAEAWTRWWWGETVVPAALSPGFYEDATNFARVLPAINAQQPVTSQRSWARLYHAWQSADNTGAFAEYPLPLSATLTAQARAHRQSFQAFLTSPVSGIPTLIRTQRFERTGYGVLARHPDGPPLVDAYRSQENILAADFAPALFAPKGWLPGSYLLALIPPDAG